MQGMTGNCLDCGFVSDSEPEVFAHERLGHIVHRVYFMITVSQRYFQIPEVQTELRYTCPLCELYLTREQAEDHVRKYPHKILQLEVPVYKAKARDWTEQEMEKMR